MCDDTVIQVICNASVKASVIALDDVDLPCHEKWSSPLSQWSSIAAIEYGPSIVLLFFLGANNRWIAFGDF